MSKETVAPLWLQLKMLLSWRCAVQSSVKSKIGMSLRSRGSSTPLVAGLAILISLETKNAIGRKSQAQTKPQLERFVIEPGK